MICRARPRYLSIEDIDLVLKRNDRCHESIKSNELYFNSGSFAFWFFLDQYREYFGRTPRVAIQSFTCITMLDAIINAGAQAYIYDIRMEDLSIDFESIDDGEVDIIVLTCYQGVPCIKYDQLADYCKKNGIILFEDLSHGRMSKSNGIQLGTRSAAYIESFSFDKPFSTLQGGRLVINELDKEFQEYIKKRYNCLQTESDKDAVKELKLLGFLLKYTREEYYREDFDYGYFIRMPFFSKVWSFKLGYYRIFRLMMSIVYKVLNRIISKNCENRMACRLNDKKIALIEIQERNYQKQCNNERINYSKVLGISNELEKDTLDIEWNRYSVIDNDGMIKKQLLEKGIKTGNFNWPRCLHQYDRDNVVIKSDCRCSEYVSEHIINIPIWHIV